MGENNNPVAIYHGDDINHVPEGYRPQPTRIPLERVDQFDDIQDAYFEGYPQLISGNVESTLYESKNTIEHVTDNHTIDFSRSEVAIGEEMTVDHNQPVELNDGTRLAIDVYRPSTEDDQVPAILSWGMWGKDAQKTVFWLRKTPQPYQEAPFWDGGLEAGDTPFLVENGYAHVIPDPRGIGQSEGGPITNLFDLHDADDIRETIEWVADRPWCNGKVGMIGPSSYAFSQAVIGQNPPEPLESLFPIAFWYTGEYTFTGMRDASLYNIFHGGHMYDSTLPLSMDSYTEPMTVAQMDSDELDELLDEITSDPDVKYNSKFYTVFQYPMKDPMAFDLFVNEWFHPHEPPGDLADIEMPTYVGSTLPGGAHHRIYYEAFEAWEKMGDANEANKLINLPPGELARPFVDYHDEVMRWNDYRLRGTENGIAEEPPVKSFMIGVNKWKFEDEWPPNRVEWTKQHLHPDGKLRDRAADGEEVSWHQPLPLENSDVVSLRFSEVINEPIEIMGPISLHLSARIDAKDTNWIADLVDVSPEDNRQLVSQGWLRASYRGLDEAESKPGWPIHVPEQQEIEPGKVYDYSIAMAPTSAVIQEGHSLELILRNQEDMASDIVDRGVYFLPLMREVTHTLQLGEESYINLPITGRGDEVSERFEKGETIVANID